jgi:hypothetical protein
MNELKGTTIEWSPDLWIRDASTQDYLSTSAYNMSIETAIFFRVPCFFNSKQGFLTK